MRTVLLALAAGGAGILALSALRHRVLARVGLRNVPRRTASTLLVVVGSMVGTALIVGSMVIGDSFARMANHAAFAHLGEIDQAAAFVGPDGQPAAFPRDEGLGRSGVDALNALTQNEHGEALVDGVLAAFHDLVPVQKLAPDGQAVLARPQVALTGVDLDAVAGFGQDPPVLPALGSGELLASASLAEELDLAAGDRVRLFAENAPHELTVAAVIPDEGLAGYRGVHLGQPGVTGSLLLRLDDAQAAFAGGRDEVNTLLVSHRGGVLDGVIHTAAVRDRLAAALGDHVPAAQLHVFELKEWVAEGGAFMGVMFGVLSFFAILAGIMLVVTIYTMLAEERRSEMGTLRGIGARRGHLVRLFAYEGLAYNLGAAATGVAAGLGVAAGIVWGLNRSAEGSWFLPDGGALVLTVRPGTLLVGGAAGLLIAMVTVTATSARTSRLNVVAAIRGLPEPPRRGRRLVGLAAAALLTVAGAGVTAAAVAGDNGYLYLLGPPALALSLGLGVRQALPTRVVMTPVLAGVAVYSQLSYELAAVRAALDDGPGIFVLSGLILLCSTIGLLALNLSGLLWLVRAVQGRAGRLLPVLRVTVAYPAARPGRTAMTLGMFALVVHAVTMIATISAGPRHHIDVLGEGLAGGFDALVVPGPQNPVTVARLQDSPPVRDGQVTTTSAVYNGQADLPEHRAGDYIGGWRGGLSDPDEALRATVTGLDEAFLRANRARLSVRAPEYATDAAAWAALAGDPDLVILDFHYAGGSWERVPALDPGQTVTLRDPLTGQERTKQVIARTTDDPIEDNPLSGIMMSADALRDAVPAAAAAPSHYLVNVADPAQVRAVAGALERDLIGQGAQVRLIADELERNMGIFLSFFRILQGFMAFGLVVGVAGVAVIAARAVHQRRRELGTLRALGFQRRMVLGSFLAEATLVGGLGIALGVATGSISGYFLGREMWRQADLPFAWPAAEIAVLAGTVYLASLLFTYLPARQASRLAPVEALRPPE